jgi:uncharacterized protein YkwD
MLMALGPALIAAAPSAAASTPGAASVAACEARVIQQINVQRLKYHRGSMVASSCPDRYAEAWAAYLARTGAFYHYSMSTILRGCRARVAAESLARGNGSADRVVAGWMASPGHRASILDGRLTRIGVAAVFANGRWTVGADFTRS